jgi:hypothetical protein
VLAPQSASSDASGSASLRGKSGTDVDLDLLSGPFDVSAGEIPTVRRRERF